MDEEKVKPKLTLNKLKLKNTVDLNKIKQKFTDKHDSESGSNRSVTVVEIKRKNNSVVDSEKSRANNKNNVQSNDSKLTSKELDLRLQVLKQAKQDKSYADEQAIKKEGSDCSRY